MWVLNDEVASHGGFPSWNGLPQGESARGKESPQEVRAIPSDTQASSYGRDTTRALLLEEPVEKRADLCGCDTLLLHFATTPGQRCAAVPRARELNLSAGPVPITCSRRGRIANRDCRRSDAQRDRPASGRSHSVRVHRASNRTWAE